MDETNQDLPESVNPETPNPESISLEGQIPEGASNVIPFRGPASGIEILVKLAASGEIDPLKMVSHRVSMDELAEVYYKFEKKEDGMQKVFVQTKFSAPPAVGSPDLFTYTK